jgi:hypothetical protein
MHYPTIILLFISTLLSAQHHSFADTITNPTLTIAQPKKEKQRELYIQFYSPHIVADDKKAYGLPYYIRPEVDTVFYRYQDFENNKYTFVGTRGLTLGYSKKYFLDRGLYFKSGLALDIFGFQYSLTTQTISSTLLTEYHKKTPSSPQAITAIEVNKERDFTSYPDITIAKPITHVIASLMLPVALDYKLSSRSYIGMDLRLRFPISASVDGYYYRSGQKIYTSKQSDAIGRMSSNVGLFYKYNLTERFFIEANASIGIGLFNPIADTTREYHALDNPILYTYGIKTGFNY